jgi:GNAT superfamily N-acetyltransferase
MTAGSIHQLFVLPSEIESLIQISEKEGFNFLSRMRNKWNTEESQFDKTGEAYFGYFINEKLVGVGGINQDPYQPGTSTGRVRHFYVHPEFRRKGIGAAILKKVVRVGCEYFNRLRLRTLNPEANHFYEAFGFSQVLDESATHELKCS